jgi:hypothetical protein
MRSATVLLLATSTLSCSTRAAVPPAEPAPRKPVASVPSAPSVNVTGCVAKPSTLYGDEPMVFELTGESASGSSVPVEVVNQRGESVFRGTSALPGTVNAGTLPSGDFSLKIAGSAVTCWVTVNRELTRGSSGAR